MRTNRIWPALLWAAGGTCCLIPNQHAAEDMFALQARQRVASDAAGGPASIVERQLHWSARHTAIVLCDMWDKHWCAGATRRVAEMAPRMNAVVKEARARGALIIHCPSDTMAFYEGTPARRLAQAAPPVDAKMPLQHWCSLDPAREAPLPIDDSDGGCDCDPPCKNYKAWSKQIEVIEIAEGDAVTDSGEAYYLMRQRGVTNVICMGVHLNLCVLGRPFSVRQMVNQGQNVVFVRDLTDTMYNSRQHPYVPHGVGTDLVAEHIERYWCPSITSADFIGGEPLRFQGDARPRVLFMIGEEEYKTAETLPAFARTVLEARGMRTQVVQADAQDGNQFPGFEAALRDADLLVVSVRRRAPSRAVLDAIRSHLNAGKPLFGIRTASHAFALRGAAASNLPADGSRAVWPGFDPEVLGGHYSNHHGNGPKTRLEIASGAEAHSVLAGVDALAFEGSGSLYKVSPLSDTATPLLIGSVPGQAPEPVAWINRFGSNQARIVYTSLGHPDDFDSPAFQRLLLNGILWALDQPVPPPSFSLEKKSRKFSMDWRSMPVPGTWKDNAGLQYDGVAWYRCLARVPANWQGAPLRLFVEKVDNWKLRPYFQRLDENVLTD